MATSLKRSHEGPAMLSAPGSAAGQCQSGLCRRLLDTRASLGQSLVGSLLLSPGSWFTQGFVCALQESVSPVLCKFWTFYGGVNGDHLQEGLCHIQIWCTQNLCPCGRPLVTRTSTGDTQTLKGSSGSDSVGSPGVHKVCLSPPSISGRYGV